MPKEQVYTVTWEIQVTAENPLQAAQYALDDYRDRSLANPILDVVDESGKKTSVHGVSVTG